jgi:hypothetical protein
MDNFFSGDERLIFLGEDGWKATMTCRHDRLPKGVPKIHFNYIKAAPANASRSKVARFEQPIVVVKNGIQPRRNLQLTMAMPKRQEQNRKTMSWWKMIRKIMYHSSPQVELTLHQ